MYVSDLIRQHLMDYFAIHQNNTFIRRSIMKSQNDRPESFDFPSTNPPLTSNLTLSPPPSTTFKMAPKFTTCTVCQKPASQNCAKCQSACYCSRVCQEKDFPLHKLLCSKLKDFIAATPRPSDMHFLALLLPLSSSTPKLFWVEVEIYEEGIEIENEENEYSKCFPSIGSSSEDFGLRAR